MVSRTRRLLSWTFIIAFFVIAPAIIFSTAGYRYNFTKHRIERTGVMIVVSRPEAAAITLNGERQKADTPARLPDLTPGTYDLRVEKIGYHPWEKTVTIESRATAFVNDVGLFRVTSPVLYSPIGVSIHPAFSPGARYAAALMPTSSGSELAIVDLRTGVDFLPYRSSSEAGTFKLSWSVHGEWLLIARTGTKPLFLLWHSDDPQNVRDIKEGTGLAFEDAFWAQGDTRLYGRKGGRLYGIPPDATSAVDEGPAIEQAIVANGSVYGILEGEPSKLVRRKLKEDAFEPIAGLPSTAFRPLPGNDGRIAYVSTTGDDLFVIDSSGDQPKAFEARGKGGVWSADGTRLLYWNDLEVRIYDARSGNDDLLTRLSGPITQAAWHAPEWNVLYAANGGLFTTESTDHYGRLTVPLAEFTTIDGFAVGDAGDFAYIYGKKDGQSGLWKLRLR
jgi:hypothetical protein